MSLWSGDRVRVPAQSKTLRGFAALFEKKDTLSPQQDEAKGITPVERKAEGGLDKNRGGAETLRRYWVHGEGAAKIQWGVPGDFDRCVALVSKYMGTRAKGYCNLRHHDAVGGWPGENGKSVSFDMETKVWVETLHPRVGDGQSGGGRFKPKGPGDGDKQPKGTGNVGDADKKDRFELSDEERSKVHDLVDELTGGGDRSDLTAEQRSAVKKIINGLVDNESHDSDAEARRPFQNMTEKHRTALRDLVDRMTGDGRFKDLPPAQRAAMLATVRGLSGPEPTRKSQEKGMPFISHTGLLEFKAEASMNGVPDGVMIAFYAPDDVAADLSIPGGTPPTDMHVTLAYLGKVGDVPNAPGLMDVVSKFAADHPPVDAAISGVGRFVGNPDGDVQYLSVDAPTLTDFRHDLVGALEDAGFAVRRDHGFTPHMTLAYLDPTEDSPIESVDPASTQFGLLSMAYGPDVWDFPMGE